MEFEKSMAEQACRKEAKICEKEAVDPSWCLSMEEKTVQRKHAK